MKTSFNKCAALILTIAMIISCMGGCGSRKADKTAHAETKIFTDSLGREVMVPAEINKVAVSGPLTEVAFYALAPELMAGRSVILNEVSEKYMPDEYKRLPLLGQIYGGKTGMDLEELVAAAPDIVLDIGEEKSNMAADLDDLQKQTGIPFVHITAELRTMGDSYRKLGELLDMKERAEEYAEYCDMLYDRTLAVIDRIGPQNKTKLLYCCGSSGTNVIAKGAYHAEIIDMLADNLAVVSQPSSRGSGNEAGMEQILVWDPEVIIFAPDSIFENVGEDPTWQKLRAISSGRYYRVPEGPYNWLGFPPAAQVYLGMMWMTDTLYPEAVDIELKAEVQKFYKMFFHFELSDEAYNDLIIK